MNDTTTASDEEATEQLEPLVEDTERNVVRTLTEDSIPSSAETAASIDDVFDALRRPEQRYVLTYLLRAEGEIRLSELLDYVLANTDVSGDEAAFRHSVAVALTNTHLPALVEKGFVEYNMERQLIRPSQNTTQAAPYLKLALEQQRLLDER